MALTERLALIVSLDAKGAVKGLGDIGRSAERELGKADDRLSQVGRTASKIGVGMIGVGAVVGGALFKMAKASEVAELQTRKLENSISNNAKLAGHSADEFTNLAKAIQNKTAADADDIVGGQAILAQFGLEADEIKNLTPLVVDLARKKGIDLTAASTAVAKAMAGQSGALKKAGVIVDETAFKTDRYKAVQDALARSVGGFAEEEGKTFAGSLERLKNQLEDISEGVGVGAVDAFTSLLDPVSKLSAKFAELDPQTQANVGRLAAFSAIGLVAAGTTLALVGKVVSARQNFSMFADQLPRTAQGLSAISKIAGVLGLLQIGDAIGKAINPVDTANLSVLERDLLDFVASGKAAGEVAEILGGDLGRLDDAVEEIAAPSNKTKLDNLAYGIATLGQSSTRDLSQARQRIADLDGALASLANRDPAAAAAALAAVKAQMDPTAYERLLPMLDKYNGALAGLDTSGRLAAGGVDEFGNATGDAAVNTGELVVGLQDLDTALRSQFDPLFAAQDAVSNLAKAQAAAAAATAEHGTKSSEAVAANADAVKAALGYESAMIRLKLAIENGDVSLNAAKGVMQAWVTQGLITQTQADEVAGSFLDVSTKAGQIPPSIGITLQTYGVDKTLSDLERVRLKYASLGTGVTKTGVTAPGVYPSLYKPDGERAHGGPVRANSTYLVGERGPELLTMGATSGTITPNDKMGGVNIGSINVYGASDANATGAVLVRRLRKEMRKRGGSL